MTTLKKRSKHFKMRKNDLEQKKTRKSFRGFKLILGGPLCGQSPFGKACSMFDPYFGKTLPQSVRNIFLKGGAGSVIGQGGYGCVLRSTNLPCLGNRRNLKNKVSKILTHDAALSELENHSYVYEHFSKKLPVGKQFIMRPPILCSPDLKKIAAVEKCDSGSEILDNVSDYKILIMPNGGLSLADLYKTRATQKWNRADKMIFLKKFQIIFDAVVLMINGNYLHHDFKPHNLLYDEKKKRLTLIDFGLARFAKDVLTKLETIPFSATGKLRPGYHFSYPKEGHLLGKNNFNRFVEILLKKNEADARAEVKIFMGTEFESQQSTYFKYSEDSTVHRREVSLEIDAMLDRIKTTVQQNSGNVQEIYKNLLEKHWKTFDSYALGFSMLYVLQKFFSEESQPGNRDSSLVKKLRELFFKMCTPNLFNRILPKEASALYKGLIERA